MLQELAYASILSSSSLYTQGQLINTLVNPTSKYLTPILEYLTIYYAISRGGNLGHSLIDRMEPELYNLD